MNSTLASAFPPAEAMLGCEGLMASLQHAHHALVAGDSESVGGALAHAYTCAIGLYGRLDPQRTFACAHVQGVLEECIERIDHAQRNADDASVNAALRLFAPLQSVLGAVID